MNKAILQGNITRDPELKALPSGSKVVNFSIATNEVYKDKQGAKQEKVEYHNCVAFGTSAENIAKFFNKGKPILVEGKIETRSWEKDGVKMYRTEINVREWHFVSGGGGGDKPQSQSHDASESQEVPDTVDTIEYPAIRLAKAYHFDETGIIPDLSDDDINPEDIPFR